MYYYFNFIILIKLIIIVILYLYFDCVKNKLYFVIGFPKITRV